VHQVGYLQGSYQDARSTKHKVLLKVVTKFLPSSVHF